MLIAFKTLLVGSLNRKKTVKVCDASKVDSSDKAGLKNSLHFISSMGKYLKAPNDN
jgi:hypothetical protein